MTARLAVRVWPAIGLAALFLLGWAVRSGPTGLDRWFQSLRHGPAQYLLFFTDPRVLLALWSVAMVVALRKRWWRLCVAAVLTPALAYILVQLLKRVFWRVKGTGLAYPSGHTTVMVVVLGLLVLALGATTWLVISCVVYSLLGTAGQGVTYHFVTDAVGALFLGTAIVCLIAILVERPDKLDGCQARLRPRSQRWLP